MYMYVICLIDESESNYYYYYRNADCTNRTYLCGEIIIISALISDQWSAKIALHQPRLQIALNFVMWRFNLCHLNLSDGVLSNVCAIGPKSIVRKNSWGRTFLLEHQLVSVASRRKGRKQNKEQCVNAIVGKAGAGVGCEYSRWHVHL